MKADPMSVHNLAKKMASCYVGKGIDFDDLVSIAMVGAVVASNKFDPEKGAFTTIAYIEMRNELNKRVYRLRMVNGKHIRLQRFIESDTESEALELLATTKETPETIFLDSGLDRLISRIFYKLSERQKTAFNDYYYIDNYDNYMSAYNVSKKQAIKAGSNAKLKVIKLIKDLVEGGVTI